MTILFITVKHSPDMLDKLSDFYDFININDLTEFIKNEIEIDENVTINIKKCN